MGFDSKKQHLEKGYKFYSRVPAPCLLLNDGGRKPANHTFVHVITSQFLKGTQPRYGSDTTALFFLLLVLSLDASSA